MLKKSFTCGLIALFTSVAHASPKFCTFHYKLESFMMKVGTDSFGGMDMKINLSGGLPKVEHLPNQANSDYDTTSNAIVGSYERGYNVALSSDRNLKGKTLVVKGLGKNMVKQVDSNLIPFASRVNVRGDGSIGLEDRAGIQILVNKENWISNPQLVMSEFFSDILLFDGTDPDSLSPQYRAQLTKEAIDSYSKVIPGYGQTAYPSSRGYFIPLFNGSKDQKSGLERSSNTLDFSNEKAVAKIRFFRSCEWQVGVN